MLSFKRYITEVATFTAKNFPRDIVGNEKFSGAGERTTYVPTSSANTFKWKDGFLFILRRGLNLSLLSQEEALLYSR